MTGELYGDAVPTLFDDELEGETDLLTSGIFKLESSCDNVLTTRFKSSVVVCDAVVVTCASISVGQKTGGVIVETGPETLRSSTKASWLYLINDGCAYISVSAPRRTLIKPYCAYRKKIKEKLTFMSCFHDEENRSL